MAENPLDLAAARPPRSHSWWRRKSVLIATGVMVAVVAVAVGVFTLVPRDSPQPEVARAPALVPGPVVEAARPSVLKIHGDAPHCYADGTGVVVAPNLVMSVAVTVAGMATVDVVDGRDKYPAHVVAFDPNANIAILEVPGLPAAPLELDTHGARPETDAMVLGYPDGGDLTMTTARVRETITLNGPNIYNSGTVNREVYVLEGAVAQGGPLIGRDGRVLGMVFGTAVDDPKDAGFALTAKELAAKMSQARTATPVSTGPCRDS